jgi:hypothetical protein
MKQLGHGAHQTYEEPNRKGPGHLPSPAWRGIRPRMLRAGVPPTKERGLLKVGPSCTPLPHPAKTALAAVSLEHPNLRLLEAGARLAGTDGQLILLAIVGSPGQLSPVGEERLQVRAYKQLEHVACSLGGTTVMLWLEPLEAGESWQDCVTRAASMAEADYVLSEAPPPGRAPRQRPQR